MFALVFTVGLSPALYLICRSWFSCCRHVLGDGCGGLHCNQWQASLCRRQTQRRVDAPASCLATELTCLFSVNTSCRSRIAGQTARNLPRFRDVILYSSCGCHTLKCLTLRRDSFIKGDLPSPRKADNKQWMLRWRGQIRSGGKGVVRR